MVSDREDFLKNEFDILIADRNPRVREFLRREMTEAGYRVHLAMNGIQVLRWASHHPVDMLIADPDLPDADSLSLLEKLRIDHPGLPVVIHTFLSDYADHPEIPETAILVEKGESSVERLKEIVSEIFMTSEKTGEIE